MSQDERPEPCEAETSQSLFLILRNNDIECGYLHKKGGSNEWRSIAQSVIPLNPDKGSFSGLDQALSAILPGNEGGTTKLRDLHVVASERWIQTLSVPWSDALLHPGREQTFLREQFHASGLTYTSADVFQVGEGPPGHPRLAAMYPGQLIQKLRAWSSHVGGDLVSVQPLYLAAWVGSQQFSIKDSSRGSRSPQLWRTLALIDKDSVCLIYGPAEVSASHGVIEGITHRYVDLTSNEASGIQLAWKRFVLRNPHLGGVQAIPVINVATGSLDLISANEKITPIDASVNANIENLIQAAVLMRGHLLTLENVAPRWKLWHWLSHIFLLLVVFIIAVRIGVNTSEYRSLNSKISDIRRNGAGSQVVKNWTKEETNRIQSINKAVRDLNVPVDALLEAIIPPKDIKVAILSTETVGRTLSATSKSSSIKLLGQACSTADMARYVAFVSDRKPFTGASLLRHEFSEKLGRCPYKFTVEAKWSD